MPTIHTPKTNLAKTASDRAVALMKQISGLPLDRDAKRSLMMKVQTLAAINQAFDEKISDIRAAVNKYLDFPESEEGYSPEDANTALTGVYVVIADA